MANISLSDTFEKQIYMAELLESAENASFWKKLSGEGNNNCVKVDKRPSKSGGAECNYAIRPYVSPRSVTNGPLDGNERNLDYYKDSLRLDTHREAVLNDGEQQDVEAFFSIDSSMSEYVKEWATSIYDALHFKSVFYEGGNPNFYAPNGVATKGALTGGDTMGKDDLTNLFTLASTGKSREFEPLRPILVDGQYWFILLCHDDVAQDIRKDLEADWGTAMPRSGSNPLFRTASMMWANVIVMSDRRCPIELGGSGGAVSIATSALLGQQAIQQIMGADFDMVTGEKDWGYQKGYAAKYIIGCKAPEFNSKRYGSILVQSARTNISGNDNLAEINYSAIDTSNQ